MFSSKKLQKAAMDSLSKQIVNSLPLTRMNGENEYNIEKVLIFIIQYWKLQYKIKWIEYNDDFK